MAIENVVRTRIEMTGEETVRQAEVAYEDLGDAVAQTQREAERLALQQGINNAETQEAIAVAAKYKQMMIELDTAIELNVSSMELLVSVAQSVVGGFTAVIGATSLFGSESEELNSILIRTQGALALTEGLNNLKDNLPTAVSGLINKFKNLNVTLRTTSGLLKGLGVGALIAGVVLLIKYFDEFTNALKRLGDRLRITNYELKEQVANQQALVDEQQRAIDLAEAQGKSEDELLKMRLKLAKETQKLTQLQLDYAKFQKDGVEEATKANLDAINQIKIAEANLTEFYKNQYSERSKLQEQFLSDSISGRFQEFKQRKEYLQNIDNLENQFRAMSMNEAEQTRVLASYALGEQLKEERKLIEDSYDLGYITKEKFDELNLKQTEIHQQRVLDLERAFQQAKRDLDEKSAMEGAQMLLDLNNIFQNQREKQNEKEFEREKAFAIAQTLISTYFAAQRAYNSQLTLTPDSPIRAVIAAAAAVTSGLSRVASIRRTRFDSEGTDSTSNPSTGGFGQALNAPAVRLPRTEAFTGERRIYVTEYDISNTQEKVKVTEDVSIVK